MSENNKKSSQGGGRNLARERAVQVLYQREITGQSVADIRRQFQEDQDMSGIDFDYFEVLISGVSGEQSGLDDLFSPHLDRAVPSLDVIERVILRLASYELAHQPEVPYRVVINEGVELTKRFGGEEGHKYVNAVLDKVAQAKRSLEMSAK